MCSRRSGPPPLHPWQSFPCQVFLTGAVPASARRRSGRCSTYACPVFPSTSTLEAPGKYPSSARAKGRARWCARPRWLTRSRLAISSSALIFSRGPRAGSIPRSSRPDARRTAAIGPRPRAAEWCRPLIFRLSRGKRPDSSLGPRDGGDRNSGRISLDIIFIGASAGIHGSGHAHFPPRPFQQ